MFTTHKKINCLSYRLFIYDVKFDVFLLLFERKKKTKYYTIHALHKNYVPPTYEVNALFFHGMKILILFYSSM